MLDLVFKNYTSQKSPRESFFVKVLNASLKVAKPKSKKVEVSVNLVGEGKIKKLNSVYRNKDKVTDVLSFPLEEKSSRNYGIMPLGDIFICLPFAKKQAAEDEMTLQAKLAQLTVHGFLHLLGYDHEISPKEAKKMLGLESKILNRIKI
jgi:probable rRNA maturation factor